MPDPRARDVLNQVEVATVWDGTRAAALGHDRPVTLPEYHALPDVDQEVVYRLLNGVAHAILRHFTDYRDAPPREEGPMPASPTPAPLRFIKVKAAPHHLGRVVSLRTSAGVDTTGVLEAALPSAAAGHFLIRVVTDGGGPRVRRLHGNDTLRLHPPAWAGMEA